MCISLSPPSITKNNEMDTSIYVQEDDVSLIIPYPKTEMDKLDTLIAPFDMNV